MEKETAGLLNKAQVLDVARWFIKNNYDIPRNTFDGNMKLQKLLYFSQLIHFANTGEVLFDEPILAFENGSVVECVRKKYRDAHSEFIMEANENELSLKSEQIETLKTTAEIFGYLKASELSNLNHLHESWREAYYKSKDGDFHVKEMSEISIDSIVKYDLPAIREMLMAHKMAKRSEDVFEVVNGISFYYDPNEIQITEEILKQLEAFHGNESSYVLCNDESRGLVIY